MAITKERIDELNTLVGNLIKKENALAELNKRIKQSQNVISPVAESKRQSPVAEAKRPPPAVGSDQHNLNKLTGEIKNDLNTIIDQQKNMQPNDVADLLTQKDPSLSAEAKGKLFANLDIDRQNKIRNNLRGGIFQSSAPWKEFLNSLPAENIAAYLAKQILDYRIIEADFRSLDPIKQIKVIGALIQQNHPELATQLFLNSRGSDLLTTKPRYSEQVAIFKNLPPEQAGGLFKHLQEKNGRWDDADLDNVYNTFRYATYGAMFTTLGFASLAIPVVGPVIAFGCAVAAVGFFAMAAINLARSFWSFLTKGDKNTQLLSDKNIPIENRVAMLNNLDPKDQGKYLGDKMDREDAMELFQAAIKTKKPEEAAALYEQVVANKGWFVQDRIDAMFRSLSPDARAQVLVDLTAGKKDAKENEIAGKEMDPALAIKTFNKLSLEQKANTFIALDKMSTSDPTQKERSEFTQKNLFTQGYEKTFSSGNDERRTMLNLMKGTSPEHLKHKTQLINSLTEKRVVDLFNGGSLDSYKNLLNDTPNLLVNIAKDNPKLVANIIADRKGLGIKGDHKKLLKEFAMECAKTPTPENMQILRNVLVNLPPSDQKAYFSHLEKPPTLGKVLQPLQDAYPNLSGEMGRGNLTTIGPTVAAVTRPAPVAEQKKADHSAEDEHSSVTAARLT